MNNFIVFFNTFCSYLLVLLVVAVLGGIAIFIGIRLRKNKNQKDEQIAASETKES